MQNPDEILIGEGVVLDSTVANMGTRLVGAVIDALAVFALLWLSSIGYAWIADTLDAALSQAVGIVVFVTAFVIAPVTLETLTRGRSLGKLAMGIRIVRDDGGPVGFRQALARALVGWFELWLSLGLIAIIASLMNSRGKRFGDMLAGTYATNVRATRHHAVVLERDPALAEWAATVDIQRLPDGLALTARRFLDRASALHPRTRHQMGVALAEQLSQYVAPAPPTGTWPEAVIAGILTTRRDREYATALRNQEEDAKHAAGVSRLPFGISS